MKKRLLAIVCMVVMVVSIFAVVATNANAANGEVTYEVGYAKVSISPWADRSEGATSTTLLSGIKFAGYGSAENRYTDTLGIIDDNGDGNVDRNDGLFATCTVVTEYVGGTEGKTLVFFTMDTLNGYDYVTTDMRQYVPALLSDANIVANQIMVSGSHNHTAPMMNDLRNAYRNEWNAAVTAAKEAGTTQPTYLDFVPTGSNQSIYYKYVLDQLLSAANTAYNDRAAATISTKSVDASDAMSGKKMNYIRHYTNSKGEIGGSNFGTTSYTAHVADAEDTLQLVKFDVAAADQDIVFVTWQAHPDNVGYAGLSSDYIGGLRYRMENNNALSGSGEDYRVAFFQGAAGNLVVSSQVSTEWTSLTATGLANANKEYGKSSSGIAKSFSYNQYGYLMGQVALSGLETGDASTWKTIVGGIRNMQYNYSARQTRYTEDELAAAKAYFADVAEEDWWESIFGSNTSFPYESNGVILSSGHHAYHILNYSVFPEQDLEEAAAVHNGTKTLSQTSLGSQTYANYAYMAIGRSEEAYHSTELHAITLGDGKYSLAFVTAPGEMFDRYDADGTLGGTIEDKNGIGWASLVNSDTYGTPILLGYSNRAMGYIANEASYRYNQGSTTYATGSYESNTSSFTRGTGEALMGVYENMLNSLTDHVQKCDHCGGDEVEFAPLAQGSVAIGSRLLSGHYYLTEDITVTAAISVAAGETICLDLNGHTIENTSTSRVFLVGEKDAPVSTLNLMDLTDGDAGEIKAPYHPVRVRYGGKVNMYGGALLSTGTSAIDNHGGTLYIDYEGAEFNLYGGTIGAGKVNGVCTKTDCDHADVSACTITTRYGGTIWLYGSGNETAAPTFRMFGGTVEGGEANIGGTIAAMNGVVELRGGEIAGGAATKTAKNGGGVGPCVYVSSAKLTLADEMTADSIYVESSSTLTVSGAFAGNVENGITFNKEVAADTVLGVADNVKMNASVKVYGKTAGDEVLYLGTSGNELVATATDPNTVAAWIDGAEYGTFEQALSAYNHADNKPIVLNKELDVTVNETIYLDLNGHNVNVTASNGTVYVLDSATDDYKGSYGSVTGTANIVVVPANSTVMQPKEGFYTAYLEKDEGNGARSFHRVEVGIAANHTNPKNAGIRYECGFRGDEFVADQVKQYGVAVSVKGDPKQAGQDKLTADAKTTFFTTFATGSTGNDKNSSYITGIMKESNGFAVNKRNAATNIYGRAYIQLDDGSYLFGPEKVTSLQAEFEAVNKNWDSVSLKSATFDLYAKFKSIMKSWDIKNIADDAEATAKTEEANTVKILTVGNSHAVDSMWMLYEVYQQRKAADPTLPNLELGILYYSGCHIDQHVEFALNDLPAYEYYKINEEIYNSNLDRGWQTSGEAITKATLDKTDPNWASKSEYVHIKTDVTATGGTYVLKNGWTLLDGLKDEQWDMVVLQESANYAAFGDNYYNKDTFGMGKTDLNWLKDYIKTNAKVVPEFSFHVQWASPMDATMNSTPSFDLQRATNFEKWFGSVSDTGDGKFANEDGDLSDEDRLAMQRKMTKMMLNNAETYISDNNAFAHKIISGAAISYALEFYKGGNINDGGLTTNENLADVNAVLYRDYTHLSDYGRLIVANLWFEELFGDGNLTAEEAVTEIPSRFYIKNGPGMTDWRKTILIGAVNHALTTPYELTWTE